MKSETVTFQEMFGSSTIAESLAGGMPIEMPELPTDNAMWEFLTVPPGAVSQQIQDADFIKLLAGVDSLPAKTDSLAVLYHHNEIEKRAPERRSAIKTILDRARGRIPELPYWSSITDDQIYGAWARLLDSCERFASAAIMEAA